MAIRIGLISLMLAAFTVGCEGVPDPNGNSNDNTGAPEGLGVYGTIDASAINAKRKAAALEQNEKYEVVAQSAETGMIYRTATDENGAFSLDIPDEEGGNNFMVAIIGPGGKAEGPVMFDANGATGLGLESAASLGTISLPEERGAAPILSGDDGDATEQVNPDMSARLNDNGIPVGVGSLGKGDEAQGAVVNDPRMAFDRDQDGLIDFIDADNDGNGVVDEIDGESDGGIPEGADVRLNFFTNLKIGNEKADTYYSGDADDIADALAVDTVITFEVLPNGPDPRTVTGIRAVEVPGPACLATASAMPPDGGNPTGLWKDADFAFNEKEDRFDVFVVPNAVVEAGDTFTIEVSYDDGTTERYSRMINFVFKNIPRLRSHGVAGSLTDFDGAQPIEFDGSEDLTLVFNPPPDETGKPVTGIDYQFEMFYNAPDNRQLNGDMDRNATFPNEIPGFSRDNTSFYVPKDDLVYDEIENTYTVTLPREIFIDAVETAGGPQAVASYKIDIAAQSQGGNAAVMLQFEKP